MAREPQPYMQNRELSWLTFNERVLEEARDPSNPLAERLKFVSIFTSNLDEFFMVRVGSLTDLALVAPNARENKGGFTPAEQLRRIYAAVVPLVRQPPIGRDLFRAGKVMRIVEKRETCFNMSLFLVEISGIEPLTS